VLLKGAGRETQMHGGIGRPQETGSNRRGSGIHGKAPAKMGCDSGLSLGFASFGVGAVP
jgi:hypothetical protein